MDSSDLDENWTETIVVHAWHVASRRGKHGSPDRLPQSPPPSASKRQGKKPARYTDEERKTRKEERKRRAAVEEQLDEHVPNSAFIGDARTTARSRRTPTSVSPTSSYDERD